MLSERDIELAHPESFDFVFSNLRPDKQAEFDRHLPGCRYCQSVVDEYSEIGGVIKLVPPDIEPRADLEERTVAAMVTARTEAEAETQHAPAPDPNVRPMVTRRPVWRRYRGRLAAVIAAAAVIIVAAIVVPLSLSGGSAQATLVIPLHATAAGKAFGIGAAAGQATARQAGASWTFDLDVHGLKPLPPNEVYVCWWASPQSTTLHPERVTGGSFVVDDSGSATVTMTTGVDPRQFPTMEITAEQPGNGALRGAVLLTGRS
jgi:hypothetical protein